MRARFTSGVLSFVAITIASLCAEPAGRAVGAVLAGRVVDARGAPVPSVTVELYEAPHGDFVNGPDWRAIVPAPEWWARTRDVSPIAVATSGSDGRWRFEGLDPTSRCRVRVKPIDGKASDAVVRYPSTPHDSLNLVLRAEGPVALLVTDAGGTPIAADVVVRGGGDSSTELPSPTGIFRTGADGRARLAGLLPGYVDIDVRVPGRALIRTFALVPAPREIVVRVGDPSGAVAEGMVTDASGAPIAGAHVVAATRSQGARDADDLLLATTDAKGRWRVAGLPPGVFLGVSVAANGFVSATGIDARRRVAPKETLSFATVLGPAGGVEGRVSGPDGKAFTGARVSIGELATETDASGRWRLDGLDAGPRELRVLAAGHYLEGSPAETGWHPGGGVWVNVKAGALTAAPDVVLRRGVRVEGRVLDERGTPVAAAVVHAWSGRAGVGWGEHRRAAAVTTSGADGAYVLDGLAPGDGWLLFACAEGMASDAAAEAQVYDPGRPVRADVTLRRLARIAGRIVDPANKPAPDVEIELIGPDRRVVRSDAAGRFEARDLRAGAYRVEPTYGDRPHREKPTISVSVGPGGEAADVVFSLDPPRAIAGIVLDERGEPAAGVFVRLKADEPWQFVDRWQGEESWWGWGTLTDAGGRFRIENLWPGGYWVEPAGAEGPVEAGTENLRLVWYRDAVPELAGPEDAMRGLNRGDMEGEAVPIEGLVLGHDGLPVPSASVSIIMHSRSGSSGHGAPVVAGRWRSTVRSGADSIDIEVTRAYDASGERLDFGPGKATGLKVDVGHVEIRMTEGRAITGRVLDADGEPVAGAAVFASPAGEENPFTGSSGTTATDVSGAFRFVGFPDGRFRLYSAPAPRAMLAEAVVAAGAAEVELRYAKQQWIEGRVIDDASRPIVGFRLTGGDARTCTSLDGSFRIGPVEGDIVLEGPGTWSYGAKYGAVRSQPVPAGTVGIELQSPRVYEVSGVVVAGDGVEERSDVEVRLDPEPADPAREPVTGSQSWHERGFSLRAPPGTWRLTATTKAWNGRDYKVHTTSMIVTCPSAGLRIKLEDARGVRGSLVGEDAAGFLVSFIAAGDAGPSTAGIASGEDGSFKWATEEAGPFLVFASRVGDHRFALAEAIPSGATALALTLEAGRRIDGRLQGFGLPFDRTKASVWAQSKRGLVVHGVIADDGTFSLFGLPPAEAWTVEARVLDGKDLRTGAALDVASGTTDLVIKPSV